MTHKGDKYAWVVTDPRGFQPGDRYFGQLSQREERDLNLELLDIDPDENETLRFYINLWYKKDMDYDSVWYYDKMVHFKGIKLKLSFQEAEDFVENLLDNNDYNSVEETIHDVNI